jgi:N-sulfoglucosamine sulfohydrolase
MNRFALLSLILCSLVVDTVTAQTTRPNILIITVDDMSADSMGTYGCRLKGTSPNMDALVRSGLRFQFAHVQVGNCMPGRNVMWSGRYPHNNGVEGFYQVKDVRHPHLVDVMKEAGYFTAIRGKTSHSTPYTPYAWDAVIDSDPEGKKYHIKDPDSYGEATARGIKAAGEAGKPFCLMVNISDPHKPFYSQVKGNKNAKDPHIPSRIFAADEVPVPGFLFDDPVVRQELSLYYSSVRRADDCLGKILEALAASGQEEKTVVMFLSDHGMPLPFAKTQLYHHSTHTPLAVRWPGVTKKGTLEKDHMVSAVDLLPTLLDIAGIEHPKGFDGRSFAAVLKGQRQADREYVIKEYNENAGRSRDPMRAIQTKKYLYLYNPWSNGTRVFATATTGTATYRQLAKLAPTNESLAERLEIYQHRVVEEFFDVEQDPDCTVNLIHSEKHQQLIQQQRDRLLAWMQETGDPMIVIFRDRENAEAREAFVQKQEAESEARRPSKKKKNDKNTPAAVRKMKLFTVQLPKAVVPGTVAKMVISHKLPAQLGEQNLHVTLIEGKGNKRVDRQVHRIKGKGQLTVEFNVPATVTDGLVRFAAFVGEDFQSNVQHYKTDPIKVK